MEVHELMALDVELENLLVESFAPPSAQNVDEFTLGNRRRVRQREE